jgi:glycosyltransferase involved in cell wall biosynthesis
MQQATFTWNLIIADDFSTDGTRDILMEYRGKYPDKIQLILQEKNVGAAQNWIDLIKTPCSKYIAYFEGDDYWTDPYKLQKQVDFLEANPEYSMTFHKVKIYNEIEHKFEEDVINDLTKEDTNLHDLLKGNYIRTVSAVIRNTSQLASLIDKIKTATPGDWLLFIIIASTGKTKYMNQEMAVYRISYSGVWSTIDNKQRKYHKELLNGYEFLFKYLKKDDYAIVYHSHMHYIGLAAIINKENKKFARFIAYKILLYYRILKFRYFGGSKYLTE